MVDPERLRRVLQAISSDLVVLEGYVGLDGLINDAAGLDRVKYRFVTAIEGCIDAAQHICSTEGWGPPDTNAEAIREMGRHGVVDSAVAEVVARAAGFRNVLVHGYASVDDAMVVDNLGRLPDLRAFVGAVAALVLEDEGR